MRTFVPSPPLKAWLDWAEQFITQGSWFNTPSSVGTWIAPRGTRINAPPLPPEPTEPEQRACYRNIVVPMFEACERFNQKQAAAEAADDIAAQLQWQQASSSAP